MPFHLIFCQTMDHQPNIYIEFGNILIRCDAVGFQLTFYAHTHWRFNSNTGRERPRVRILLWKSARNQTFRFLFSFSHFPTSSNKLFTTRPEKPCVTRRCMSAGFSLMFYFGMEKAFVVCGFVCLWNLVTVYSCWMCALTFFCCYQVRALLPCVLKHKRITSKR